MTPDGWRNVLALWKARGSTVATICASHKIRLLFLIEKPRVKATEKLQWCTNSLSKIQHVHYFNLIQDLTFTRMMPRINGADVAFSPFEVCEQPLSFLHAIALRKIRISLALDQTIVRRNFRFLTGVDAFSLTVAREISYRLLENISKYMRSLTNLCIYWCSITDSTVIALRGLTSSLLHLDLSDNEIGDKGVSVIADCPFADSLQTLKLCRNEITRDGVAVLARRFTNLLSLDLDGNDVGQRGAHHISMAEFYPRLTELSLSMCQIDDAAVCSLVARKAFHLEKISLSMNLLSNVGLLILISTENLTSLGEVWIYNNDRITDQGVLDCVERAKPIFQVLRVQNGFISADVCDRVNKIGAFRIPDLCS